MLDPRDRDSMEEFNDLMDSQVLCEDVIGDAGGDAGEDEGEAEE